MKKENTQNVIAKNKKRTRIICYISLVFLVILIFIPPLLRLLIEEKEEVKVNVVMVLNCNKLDESINSTFLNDKPKNLMYTIKGDLTVTETPDESNENDDSSQVTTSLDDNNVTSVDNDNSQNVNNGTSTKLSDEITLYEMLKPYSSVSYDNVEEATVLRSVISDFMVYSEYASFFASIDSQEQLFQSKGFTCTRSTV